MNTNRSFLRPADRQLLVSAAIVVLASITVACKESTAPVVGHGDTKSVGTVPPECVLAVKPPPGGATSNKSPLAASAMRAAGRAFFDCDDNGSSGGGYPPPDNSGLALSDAALASCHDTTAASDSDGDHLSDVCENALATAFAPGLVVNAVEVDSTVGQLGGEYYYAVMPQWEYDYGYRSYIRLAYLPAYYRDLGNVFHWFGNGIAFISDGGHSGDSEFILVDVVFDPGVQRFKTLRVFLSAHCGSRAIFDLISTDPDCQWWPPSAFGWVDGVQLGAPIVWVANFKRSNYYSSYKCTGGSYAYDHCDQWDRFETRFPVTPGFNIGSRTHQIGPVYARRGGVSLVDPSRAEDLWSYTEPFRGWQPADLGEGTTSYGNILDAFGFIREPPIGVSPGCNRPLLICFY